MLTSLCYTCFQPILNVWFPLFATKDPLVYNRTEGRITKHSPPSLLRKNPSPQVALQKCAACTWKCGGWNRASHSYTYMHYAAFTDSAIFVTFYWPEISLSSQYKWLLWISLSHHQYPSEWHERRGLTPSDISKSGQSTEARADSSMCGQICVKQ